MPELRNDPDQQTGNFKTLSVLVSLLIMAGVGISYAYSINSSSDTSPQPNEQLQAQDKDTQSDESVSEADTVNEEVPSSDEPVKTYTVTSISDGDTIKAIIDGRIETIRLIGVNTPEIKDPRRPVQCYGKQASEYTSMQLLGKSIQLESDETQQDRDRYGRLLRYVYVDGRLFNEELIRNGYASEYTFREPYRYQEEFIDAQQSARDSKQGLWNPNNC